jgi:hypothetical protein
VSGQHPPLLQAPFPTSTLVAFSGFVHPDALIEINAVTAVRQPSVR